MLAFAATLLVVSLDPPNTYDELITNLFGFIPFGLSFIALFYIWVVHTILFRRYPLEDKPSIFINGILLFTVLFYVQPLRFLATSFVSLFTRRAGAAVTSWDQLANLFIIYAVGWILIFLLVAWLYQRANATRDSLGLTPLEAYDAVTWSRHYLCFVAAGVVSILIALSGVGLTFGLAGIAYASIGLFVWYNQRVRDRGRVDLAEKIAAYPHLTRTHGVSRKAIRELLK